jgi:hypothetical protein
MRIYSLAFHVLLSLAMIAVGLVARCSGNPSLNIGFLPWTGTTLTHILLLFGALGVALAVLAYFRIVPVLFTLWSLAVVVMLVRGYFLSSYYFGPTGISTALWFTLAALLALVGSALPLRRHSTLA